MIAPMESTTTYVCACSPAAARSNKHMVSSAPVSLLVHLQTHVGHIKDRHLLWSFDAVGSLNTQSPSRPNHEALLHRCFSKVPKLESSEAEVGADECYESWQADGQIIRDVVLEE